METIRQTIRGLQGEATRHYKRAAWWKDEGWKLEREAQRLAYRLEAMELAERAPAVALRIAAERERALREKVEARARSVVEGLVAAEERRGQIERRAPSYVGEG